MIKFISKMGSDLTIVNAARVSFDNHSESLNEKDIKLIKYLAKHEHLSPFEHCTMTVLVECPLYIRSQIHRHRTFAFNEVSRRYTSEGMQFYLPPIDDIRAQSKSNRQASDSAIDNTLAQDAQHLMDYLHKEAMGVYAKLLELGVCREQARGILPQNLLTKFYMTGNLRNLVHFIKLRTHEGAQKEVRDLAEQMKSLIMEHFPEASKALFEV